MQPTPEALESYEIDGASSTDSARLQPDEYDPEEVCICSECES